MNNKMQSIYIHSDNIVAREIEGEIIIVPLIAGIGDLEDEIFTLNGTGKAIWDKLDGEKELSEIIEELSKEYIDVSGDITSDVLGFIQELSTRRMLVEVSMES